MVEAGAGGGRGAGDRAGGGGLGEAEPFQGARFLYQSRRFRYCRMLEEGSFRGRTADFVFMFLFGGVLMTVSFLGSGTCGSRPVLALGPCLSAGPEGELRPRAEGVFERTSRAQLQVPLSNSRATPKEQQGRVPRG